MTMALTEQELRSEGEFAALAVEMCGARRDAAVWLAQLCDLATLWDHAADGQPVDRERLNDLMTQVLVGWTRNAFWLEHMGTLSSVMLNAILAWQHSDGDPLTRLKAYDVATEVGCTVAALLGGIPAAQSWSPRLRQWALARCKLNDQTTT